MIDAQVVECFLFLFQMQFILNQVLESSVLNGPESVYCYFSNKSVFIFFCVIKDLIHPPHFLRVLHVWSSKFMQSLIKVNFGFLAL